MSNTKNMYWDEAEKALDVLKAKKDAGESIESIVARRKRELGCRCRPCCLGRAVLLW